MIQGVIGTVMHLTPNRNGCVRARLAGGDDSVVCSGTRGRAARILLAENVDWAVDKDFPFMLGLKLRLRRQSSHRLGKGHASDGTRRPLFLPHLFGRMQAWR